MSTLEYRAGVATSPQIMFLDWKDFLVTQCGWTLRYTISDTDSDRWYVFFVPTTEPDRWTRQLIVSCRATNTWVDLTGGTAFTEPSTFENDMYANGTTNAPANGNLYYHFFGDADGAWMVYWSASDNSWYYLYMGIFDSFWSDEDEDGYPVCLIGHRYDYNWLDSTRIRAFGPWILGSGSLWTYYVHKDIYTYGYNKGAPGTLDGSIMLSRLPFREWSEVRGVLKHCKGVSGRAMVLSGGWISVSGTNHKYFTCGHNEVVDEWIALGPVDTASGTDSWW